MRYAILGPLEVSDVTLGGARPRAVLVALLVHANEPVSHERLALALWGDDAPFDAVATVRTYVSRVRRALPDPQLIETTPLGYRLTVGPGELDAERFETGLAAGRAALREGRHEDAAQLLEQALDEWRGDALAEFPFVADEAARLHELRQTAREAHMDSRLQLGSGATLVAELVTVAAAHPLRERPQAQLMTALYRAGRQAEALEVYQRAHRTFVDQLGLEPSAELRALQRAILTHELRAPPQPVPLPYAVAREVGHGAFVGRAEALARLRARWALAEDGARQFVLLSGEPGIGKTRLASEFATELHAAGATVLYGRSDYESIVPYQPFIEALKHPGALSLPPELEPELSELARFIPALRAHVPPAPGAGDPQTRRFQLYEAVARVLDFAAGERPVALLLDDLHWADTATVLLLRHVLDADQARLLVLGMTRGAEPLERFRYERIELGGLDAAETRELAGLDAGGELLRDRTAGNPLFIGELLRSVEGEDEDERTLIRSAVPEGVKATIGRRLAALNPAAVDALMLASVAGREFRFELIAALLDVPEDDLLTALEQATEAGLLREVAEDPGRLVFAHALMQEALYERQSATRRVRAHARIAAELATTGAKPAEIARHYQLARRPEAARYSILAAQEATAAFAYEEAVEHYRRALPETPSVELLLALASAERSAGDVAARETYLRVAELARGSQRHELLAQVALSLPFPYAVGGELDREGVELLEEARSLLGERDDPLVVKLLAHQANLLHFHASQARLEALSGDALAMARRVGDREALAIALESYHTAHFHIGYLDERLALMDELLTLAREEGRPELEALAHFRRTHALLEAGDVPGARAACSAMAELAEAMRDLYVRHHVACFDVVWAEIEDRIEDAWALSKRALALGERAPTSGRLGMYRHRLALWHREGTLGENVDAIRAGFERRPYMVMNRALLCLALLDVNQPDEARALFAAAGDFADVPRDVFWFSAMAALCECAERLGDARRAALLYAELLPFRDRFAQAVSAVCWGSAEFYLGLLAETMGDAAAAREHHERGIARNEAAGLHFRAERGRARLAPAPTHATESSSTA